VDLSYIASRTSSCTTAVRVQWRSCATGERRRSKFSDIRCDNDMIYNTMTGYDVVYLLHTFDFFRLVTQLVADLLYNLLCVQPLYKSKHSLSGVCAFVCSVRIL